MSLSLLDRVILLARANRLACLAGGVVLVLGLALILVFVTERGGIRTAEDSRALDRIEALSLDDIRRSNLVPDIIIDRIDVDLAKLSAKERKRDFFRIILPLIARENDRIRQLRQSLLKDPAAVPASLYERYRVEPGDIAALKRRVDIIPASLVLAQAALESGWGTSRFALEGNNLFGMRTYDADAPGLVPAAGKGFKVMRFDTLGAGVAAYMRNLNTHSAYKKLRATRAAMRQSNKKITGSKLAVLLTSYSEIPGEYGRRLLKLMTQERLAAFDGIRLASK